MNRRRFFGMIAGVLGALSVPFPKFANFGKWEIDMKWDASGGDVIADIEAMKKNIRNNCGYQRNVTVVSWAEYKY